MRGFVTLKKLKQATFQILSLSQGWVLVASVFVLHITSPSDGSRHSFAWQCICYESAQIHYWAAGKIGLIEHSLSRHCVRLFLRQVPRVNTFV
jgi:hypothetical protein